MCEKMVKTNKKPKEIYENEFNADLEVFDDFENFEQFLKNFKKNGKEFDQQKYLDMNEFPKDFNENEVFFNKQKNKRHHKSKTIVNLIDADAKKHKKLHQTLKKFSVDDTFL